MTPRSETHAVWGRGMDLYEPGCSPQVGDPCLPFALFPHLLGGAAAACLCASDGLATPSPNTFVFCVSDAPTGTRPSSHKHHLSFHLICKIKSMLIVPPLERELFWSSCSIERAARGHSDSIAVAKFENELQYDHLGRIVNSRKVESVPVFISHKLFITLGSKA